MYGSDRATVMSATGLISRSRNSMEYEEIHYLPCKQLPKRNACLLKTGRKVDLEDMMEMYTSYAPETFQGDTGKYFCHNTLSISKTLGIMNITKIFCLKC